MTDQTASGATILGREPDTERVPLPHDLRDFTATPRMLIIGAAGAALAWALLVPIAVELFLDNRATRNVA